MTIFELVLVGTVWVSPQNVTFLSSYDDGCVIKQGAYNYEHAEGVKCSDAAKIINDAIAKTQGWKR